MTALLAPRIATIGFSPTLAISDLAARMRADGIDVLDFSAGQPDFPTPDSVKDAAKLAIDRNQTRYTSTVGIQQLREAIAGRLHRDLGLDYETGQIVVSPGAKASLYFACMALLGPGDTCLVPSPYWTSYPEQIRLAGAEPEFIDCPEQQGFRLRPDQLEAAITPRTRVLLLNYPSNPTGACYGPDELAALAEVCVRHDLWIIADEIYSKLLFDGRRFTSIAGVGPEIRDRTVLIDGMSKTYSMTGWRIGYAAGPTEVIAAMGKIQSHATSNATSISQWASVRALEMAPSELAPRTEEFQRRRDTIVTGLRDLPGVTCVKPEGAFYVFPSVSGVIANRPDLVDGTGLATLLLEKARVAVVPGAAFGAPGHIRLSYAVSVERIREGLERIRGALDATG